MSYPQATFNITNVIDSKLKGLQIITTRAIAENSIFLVKQAINTIKDIITLENEALQGHKYVDNDFNIS